MRHKAMFRLHGNQNNLKSPVCITTDGEIKILITGFAALSQADSLSPDLLVVTGTKPGSLIKTDLNKRPKALVIVNETRQRSGLSPACADTLHYVRTTGAFCLKL